jgi:hypothetical protein
MPLSSAVANRESPGELPGKAFCSAGSQVYIVLGEVTRAAPYNSHSYCGFIPDAWIGHAPGGGLSVSGRL